MAETKTPWYKKVKVMVGLTDAVISIVAIILGLKLAPEKVDKILAIIITLQPVLIAIITGHTITDIAALKKKDE